MPIEKVQVSLPAEVAEFAKGLVDGREFVSLDDVIVQALYQFRPIVETERRELERLRAEVQVGIEAADRGECVDGPSFMRELIERSRRAVGQAP
jgi:Arc/MetJ-type ribon-helix-helix transcriptional regulator